MQRNLDNFSLAEKALQKKVSYTNMKQNQLLKISFVRTVAHKTRNSDDFRELYENEPEMAALRVETKFCIDICDVIFRDQIIPLKLLSLFQGFPRLLTS